MSRTELPPIVGISTASGAEVEEGGIFKLLDSLRNQPAQVILILRDGTDAQVTTLERHPSVLSLVRSGPSSLSSARNRGLLELREMRPRDDQVVTFPDDDGFYPPTLLPQALELTRTHDLVLGSYGEDNPECRGGQPEPLTHKQVYRVANSVGIFVPWWIVRSVGGFDENLGVGSPLVQAGEDLDFIMAACALTDRAIYCSYLQVQHPVVSNPRPERAGAHITVALRYAPDPASIQVLCRSALGSLMGISHVPRRRLLASLRRLPRRGVDLA